MPFVTFRRRKDFATHVRDALNANAFCTLRRVAEHLQSVVGWPACDYEVLCELLHSAGFDIRNGLVIVHHCGDPNMKRFDCADSYASFVVMRAAYCAMDFGDTKIASYVQDCFEASMVDDRLGVALAGVVRGKLEELGYKW